jgi:8-amino-7-oxononanoate synthase
LHSTALPAAACAAALAALDVIHSEEFRRTELQARSETLRAALLEQGWNMNRSMSHIVPISVAEQVQAERIANSLQSAGYYLPWVKPAGDSSATLLRLRINYGHGPAVIDEVISLMKGLAPRVVQR